MFIEDGSTIDYSSESEKINRYSWGWLGDNVPHNKCGWTDKSLKKQVLARLKYLETATELAEGYDGEKYQRARYRVISHCGWHDCEICGKNGAKPLQHSFNGSILIEHNGREFRCPFPVTHYIEKHDYNPGPVVIDALFNGRVFTYDEIDGEAFRQMSARITEHFKQMEEENRKREEAKTPEQKAYETWAKKKVEQLRSSGAIIG